MPTSHAPQPSPSRMVGFAGHSAAVGVVAFADVVFTATWSGSLGGPMAWVPLGDEASQRAGELLCHGERCPGADLVQLIGSHAPEQTTPGDLTLRSPGHGCPAWRHTVARSWLPSVSRRGG